MRTVEEVRRLRLLKLREGKSWVELGAAVGLTARDSTLSQIANQSIGSKTGKPKTMGSELARRLEIACGKPEGWMDTDPAYDGTRWPFGDRVDIERVERLPDHLLSEAVGALNYILSRAAEGQAADSGNREAA